MSETPVTSPDSTEFFRTVDLRGRHLSRAALKAAVPRVHEESNREAEDAVRGIIAAVRDGGHAALRDFAQRFDGVSLEQVRVPRAALRDALAGLDAAVRAALEESIHRARLFAEAQRPGDVETVLAEGAVVRQRWIPVSRVGLYVPGGLAPLASSVVMNVVPALAAGVTSVALASPPQKDHGGLPHPTILAAAELLGIEEVYAMGGAQAIAAFAYGVAEAEGSAEIEAVDLITGPGNVYVATAKRLVRGVVGIDSEAGPTEIAVLADHTARASLVAADLISQAEHDPRASSVLITPSTELADAVREELLRQIVTARHGERITTALSGPQSGVVLVDDVSQGVAVADAYAAEHLEIMTEDSPAVAARIRNAGAIFVGDYSPVSLGDYCAGSNHVLPTSGTALFSSGLNVTTFLRAVQEIEYSRDALKGVRTHIEQLASAENLPSHGEAVSIRFR
ncbi:MULTISPECIES: histidinol dehydrogenase [Arthrobacter]|uniref:Histidinol dehydrogenase n=2 Tax=Arthrobacter TaxID=1663 RepID=A0ABU9KH36_9MICC|nr:histidinol dehydrogenase [Arthrobacter sp. YJM1]MDP5226190.1 histidinol dehydrogenase [Arthrobacter sp. YJM1]